MSIVKTLRRRVARPGVVRALVLGFALAVATAGCGADGAGGGGLVAVSRPHSAGDVLARVGGAPILRQDLEQRVREIPPYAREKYDSPEGRAQILDGMIKEQVLVQAALRDGYLEDAAIRQLLRQAEEQVLQREYFRREVRDAPGASDEDLRRYYETNRAQFKIPDRWHARHILVAGAARASEIASELRAGADFATLATEVSEDRFTRDNGGDIGWVEQDGVIPSLGRNPEFEARVLALAIGELSEPIETLRGWHVVQLLGREERGFRELEEVREEIVPHLLIAGDEVAQHYRENLDKFTVRASVRLAHILLPSREAAERVYRRLAAGEDFARLAAGESTDAATRELGGDLGTLVRGGMVRGFGRLEAVEKAAFARIEDKDGNEEAGELRGPVASEAGWHLLRVSERREELVRPLAEVADTIRRQLYRERKQQLEAEALDRLAESVGVEKIAQRL